MKKLGIFILVMLNLTFISAEISLEYDNEIIPHIYFTEDAVTGDTNETTRINNAVGNCSGGEQVFGFNNSFHKVCVTDAVGAGGGGNTTGEIWAVVDNNTFIKFTDKHGNTSDEIWSVVDNGTFLKSYTESDPLWSSNLTAHNTTWSTDTDTFNTTDEIWTVVNNNTFPKGNETTRFNALTTNCTAGNVMFGVLNNGSPVCVTDAGGGNTTAEIWAVVDNNTFIEWANESELNVNSSNYWDEYNITNSTQFSLNLGVLNIDLTWLYSLFYSKSEVDSHITGNISDHESTFKHGNTTDEIWGVANNGTFLTSGGNETFGNFVGVTSSQYNGNLSNSSHVGYVRANILCADEYAGSHFCLEVEIMKTNVWNNTMTGQYWIVKGAPGYTANANDCEGWTKTTGEIGPFWDFNENGGVGAGKLTPCSSTLNLSCCG